MKFISNPEVYLVGRSEICMDGFNRFLEKEGLQWPTESLESLEKTKPNGSRIVELAGRLCYMSFGSKAGSKTHLGFIKNLLGVNPDGTFKPGPAHGSVLEHLQYNFIVVGAGRGFSHEQVRHRAGWAYSQLSTRYCDFEREEESGCWEPRFVLPPLLDKCSEKVKIEFKKSLENSHAAYCAMVNVVIEDIKNNEEFMKNLRGLDDRSINTMVRKAARGVVRDVLPIATESIMMMSANPRAIWNALNLRGSEHAEGAIRQVYVQIAKIMKRELPEIFSDVSIGTCWDGSEIVVLPREKL